MKTNPKVLKDFCITYRNKYTALKWWYDGIRLGGVKRDIEVSTRDILDHISKYNNNRKRIGIVLMVDTDEMARNFIASIKKQ